MTDILTAKIAHGFDYLDATGDGHLTEQDHVELGQRAATGLGHASGSPEEERIIAAFTAIWDNIHRPHLPEGQDQIDKAAFVAATRSLEPEAADATVGAMARTFLAIADTDGNGVLSAEEFAVFQRALFPEITQDDIDKAFAFLDRDGNGYLTATEFTTAVLEYWNSTDPDAPGNWYLGQPVYER
jgi:hypothetical protein